MAYSYIRYSGNGSTRNYSFPFGYLDKNHIKVSLNGVITSAYTFLNASTVYFDTAPASGVSIEIRRVTPKDTAPVDFQDGSVILERDLDLLATFNLYVSQETDDLAADGFFVDSDGAFDGNNRRIKNVGTPTANSDAVNKEWAETGMTSQLFQATSLVSQAQSLVNQADSIIASFTVSTAAPSGGKDGDVWFKVSN